MKTSIFNCSITKSISDSGAFQLYNWEASESDRTIANTLIASNIASGIYSQVTDDSTAHWRIINTTISDNLKDIGTDNGYGIKAFALGAGVLTTRV
ncbi:TPA: hypothetical protein EYP66_22320 [Candidatus Poribacteria bacterium]|nr:hypothetical protein [Candidatus Poribacteria bacterium]